MKQPFILTKRRFIFLKQPFIFAKGCFIFSKGSLVRTTRTSAETNAHLAAIAPDNTKI
ncbi:MAG: hypothetical protein LBL74_07125 [Bacteroidales bacterium]|jgi:hypothetical protein|nr:hypothetical protein [Bacteroidales bacterium]